jgi:hypothetical protein
MKKNIASEQGARHEAASANLSDVQVEVDKAVNGDTVVVPAGAATWAGMLDCGSKAISIVGAAGAVPVTGAGAVETVITNRSPSGAVMWSGTGSNFFRLSGFRFNSLDNTGSEYSVIVIIKGPATSFRVDNCFFDKGDCAIGCNYMFQRGSGPTYGVIDHCTFLNMKRPAFPMDCRTSDHAVPGWPEYDGQTAWETPPEPGTEKMVFWENCLFKTDGNLTDVNAQGALYGQYGGKACFRYNTCEGLIWVDAHGDSPNYSTQYYEIYNNTFNVGVGGQPSSIWMRGGIAIVHDNTFNGGPKPFRMSVYWTTDVRRIGYQGRDTFYWGNKYGGASQSEQVFVSDSGQTPAGYSAANIREGQEYWLSAPVAGQWCYPYTPYTYPHPLISGGSVTPPEPVEPPLMSGLSFQAEAGAIDAPYAAEGGLVSQSVVTTAPGEGGRIRWRVTIPEAGEYIVKALVRALDNGADSMFIEFDAEPNASSMWCVIPLTMGVEERTANWLGSGGAAPEFDPKIWTLSAGEHTLYIRGREAGCALDTIMITPKAKPEPPEPPTPTTKIIKGTLTEIDGEAATGTIVIEVKPA